MRGPIDTVNRLVAAINGGDLERAAKAYEPEAVLVYQPGQLASGSIQLREVLAGLVGIEATLTSEVLEVIEEGDVALCLGHWNLRGKDPEGQSVLMAGDSADI